MKAKKLVSAIIILYSLTSLQAQLPFKKPNLSVGKDRETKDSPAQSHVDGANNYIANLKQRSESPKWSDAGYKSGYKSQLEGLASKIQSIKNADPKYNVSDIEKEYNGYKAKMDEGMKQIGDAKQANKNQQEENDKKAKEEKAKKDRVTDEGITGPIHEKYVQKIVFSSSEIPKASSIEANFSTDFNITSSIYFRAYFKESIFNSLVSKHNPAFIERDGGLFCKIYIDGVQAYNKGLSITKGDVKYIQPAEKKTLTTINGVLNLKQDKMGSSEFIMSLMEKETILTPGKHTFKMEIYPGHISEFKEAGELMASGEFNLIVVKDFVSPSDYLVCMPVAKKKDPALEAKFKESLNEYWKEKGTPPREIKKLVIRSSDWTTVKNEISGKIMYRSMTAAIGTTENGKCKFFVYDFFQEWDGSKYKSKTTVEATGGSGDIFCECLK